MRFGVCASIHDANSIAEAGYDYIELSVAADLIPEVDDEDWADQRNKITSMRLVPEAFNSFVRTGKIVGPEIDTEWLRRYVDTALRRAAEVGGKVIVLGSGGARNVPDGFPRETAMLQFRDFLGYCAEASDNTGVIVAIEPLRSAETNLIHLVREATELVRHMRRNGVQVLADSYHMAAEGEDLGALLSATGHLSHVHVSEASRGAPGTGEYDFAAFFHALAQAGYDGRCSIEANWDGQFRDLLVPALETLRSADRARTP